MTIAERPAGLSSADSSQESLDIAWKIRLFALQSLLKTIELLGQQRDQRLQRVRVIKDRVMAVSDAEAAMHEDTAEEGKRLLLSTGNLHAECQVVRNREETLRIAKLQYRRQVLPVGVSFETAAQTAPAFRRVIEEGRIDYIEVDPITLEPKPTD